MDMLYAAFFSGVALANAGLGAVHGFAGPLGGMLGSPHGALCAALLPPVVEVNVRALRERAPDSPALARYTEVAALVTGRGNAVAEDLVAWLKDLSRSLRVPTLAELGFHPELLAEAIEKARKASSMKANPIDLSPSELEAILALACERRQ
jgi:alcohol dehydrogenase class IV